MRGVGALIAGAAVCVGGAHAAFAAVPHQAALAPAQSRYKPLARVDTLLTGATILDGVGGRLEGGGVLIRDGRIVAVGHGVAHEGAVVVNVSGRWVTPGLIHIHMRRPGVQITQCVRDERIRVIYASVGDNIK